MKRTIWIVAFLLAGACGDTAPTNDNVSTNKSFQVHTVDIEGANCVIVTGVGTGDAADDGIALDCVWP